MITSIEKIWRRIHQKTFPSIQNQSGYSWCSQYGKLWSMGCESKSAILWWCVVEELVDGMILKYVFNPYSSEVQLFLLKGVWEVFWKMRWWYLDLKSGPWITTMKRWNEEIQLCSIASISGNCIFWLIGSIMVYYEFSSENGSTMAEKEVDYSWKKDNRIEMNRRE